MKCIMRHFIRLYTVCYCKNNLHRKKKYTILLAGVQWLSGRVFDSRLKGRGFESHRCHCLMSLSKNIKSSLVMVQPRKTRPFLTDRLLMGGKESNKQKLTLIVWRTSLKIFFQFFLWYFV